MTKEDSKLFLLKDKFIDSNRLSVKDICTLMDIKRSRVYDYINMLKEEGINLISEKEGRTVYYMLAETVSDTALYQPASRKDILRARILYELQYNNNAQGIHAYDLCDRLSLSDNDPSDRNRRYSTYYKEIKAMLDEGLLKIDRKTDIKTRKSGKKCLYVSDSYFSFMLSVDKEHENRIMGTVAKGQNQSGALRSLQRKIAILTGDNETSDFDESIFLQYGRGYHIDSLLAQYYQELKDNHFKDYVLELDYHDIHIRFATGLVVYSQDKDMLYLFGYSSGNKQFKGNRILKYTDISNLTYTDIPNKEYGQKKYEEILENMFSISDSKAERVEVHFADTPLNRQRIDRLCKLRVHASYAVYDKTIIYNDIIGGMDDFANYLRKFTGEYRVISPGSLIKSINASRKRIIEHYQNKEDQ